MMYIYIYIKRTYLQYRLTNSKNELMVTGGTCGGEGQLENLELACIHYYI